MQTCSLHTLEDPLPHSLCFKPLLNLFENWCSQVPEAAWTSTKSNNAAGGNSKKGGIGWKGSKVVGKRRRRREHVARGFPPKLYQVFLSIRKHSVNTRNNLYLFMVNYTGNRPWNSPQANSSSLTVFYWPTYASYGTSKRVSPVFIKFSCEYFCYILCIKLCFFSKNLFYDTLYLN